MIPQLKKKTLTPIPPPPPPPQLQPRGAWTWVLPLTSEAGESRAPRGGAGPGRDASWPRGPAGTQGEGESRHRRGAGGGPGRAGGPRGEAAEGGGMPGEREGPAGGRARGAGKGGGAGVRSPRAGGCEAETAGPPAAEGARPGDPPSPPRCGQPDRTRCVQEAPGHVQPELPEKTLQPLGECPLPERDRSPGAPGPPRAPLPGLPAPGGRAPVAPGKAAPRAGGRAGGAGLERARGIQGAEGVKAEFPGDGETRACGPQSEPPPSPRPLRQITIPPRKRQRPASGSFSRGLDFGAVFWGVLCCPLPRRTSLVGGERATVASRGNRKILLLFLRNPVTKVSRGDKAPAMAISGWLGAYARGSPPGSAPPSPCRDHPWGPCSGRPHVPHPGEERWSQIR